MFGGTTPGGSGSLWGGTGGTGGGSLPNINVGPGLLYPALRKAGVTLGPQRKPSPAQYQDGLEELNRLIGSLNCDRLFIYTQDRYVAPLTESKTYTIGLSNDPNVTPDLALPRPQKIESANVISPGDPAIRYALGVVDSLAWPQIGVQDSPGGIPSVLYDDYAYPMSTLYLYPQASSGYLLEMYCWHLVPTFFSADDFVYLPPGYEDALVLNLAVRLAPHFQRNVDPNVREDARISLMRVESINAPKPIADLSGGLGCGGRGFNIYEG
jgi:hypothetical protein